MNLTKVVAHSPAYIAHWMQTRFNCARMDVFFAQLSEAIVGPAVVLTLSRWRIVGMFSGTHFQVEFCVCVWMIDQFVRAP